MYDTILFPTDGSGAADAALDHAVDHARQYDATLHVLFVAQDEFGPSGLVHAEHDDVDQSNMVGEHEEAQSSGMTNEDAERLDAIADHGEAVVSDAAAAVGDNVTVETAVLSGTPYERILDYADSEGIDMVVMGTHGRTVVLLPVEADLIVGNRGLDLRAEFRWMREPVADLRGHQPCDHLAVHLASGIGHRNVRHHRWRQHVPEIRHGDVAPGVHPVAILRGE